MTIAKTFEEKSQSEEWEAWRFVSEMLDTPDENGIYQTSKCYEQIHDFVVEQKKKALTQHHQDRMSALVEKVKKISGKAKVPEFGDREPTEYIAVEELENIIQSLSK